MKALVERFAALQKIHNSDGFLQPVGWLSISVCVRC